eukprot:Hpha_TRINITY_DN23391_c0_g1::TRINITY_DN23391_c0_g1_i1::g.96890::m.96890
MGLGQSSSAKCAGDEGRAAAAGTDTALGEYIAAYVAGGGRLPKAGDDAAWLGLRELDTEESASVVRKFLADMLQVVVGLGPGPHRIPDGVNEAEVARCLNDFAEVRRRTVLLVSPAQRRWTLRRNAVEILQQSTELGVMRAAWQRLRVVRKPADADARVVRGITAERLVVLLENLSLLIQDRAEDFRHASGPVREQLDEDIAAFWVDSWQFDVSEVAEVATELQGEPGVDEAFAVFCDRAQSAGLAG